MAIKTSKEALDGVFQRCQRALVGTMVSQTEADPGYPPGLVPCLGRLPDGEFWIL